MPGGSKAPFELAFLLRRRDHAHAVRAVLALAFALPALLLLLGFLVVVVVNDIIGWRRKGRRELGTSPRNVLLLGRTRGDRMEPRCDVVPIVVHAIVAIAHPMGTVPGRHGFHR